jgi:Uma2 family endonuclease
MTVEEFAQMDTADTDSYELVAGELVPFPSLTPRENMTRDRLSRLLGNYFEINSIGEAFSVSDCQVSSDTVRRTGIAIFLADRVHDIDLDKSVSALAPDIAVEILTPSQTAIGLPRKVSDFLRAGSKEVWLLDYLNGEVMLHTKTGILALEGAELLESSLLPGFSVPVAELLRLSPGRLI